LARFAYSLCQQRSSHILYRASYSSSSSPHQLTFAKGTLPAAFSFQKFLIDRDTSGDYTESDLTTLHAMQPSNTDAQPDGPAAINPTDKAAEVSARLNPAGAKKEPRLRPEPTPIFKGRTFYIAPGLPSHFEANLKEEIKVSCASRL
jgi:hypothetical protein